MKQATRQKFPPGWDENKVRAVIAHYDQQSEEEAAAEIESALEIKSETLMSVPAELVGAVTRLIKDHARNGSPTRLRNPKKKTRPKKPR